MQYHFQGTHCSGKIIIMETNLNTFFAKNKITFNQNFQNIANICCKSMENVAMNVSGFAVFTFHKRERPWPHKQGGKTLTLPPGHTSQPPSTVHCQPPRVQYTANHIVQYIANHLVQCNCQPHSTVHCQPPSTVQLPTT